MDEGQFNRWADAMLAKIEAGLERAAGDIDFEAGAGGVLEIELADASKIIVNRHSAMREIWIAAKSGGYHFKPVSAERWVAAKDGEELLATLARCIAEQGGGAVDFGP